MWRREVFLSYSRYNSQRAQDLYEFLRGAGVTCWLDRADATAEAYFQTPISSGLVEAAALCVLMTDEAVHSEWVKQEVQHFGGLSEFPPEQQGGQDAQMRTIHIIHSVGEIEAAAVIDSWLRERALEGAIPLIYSSGSEPREEILATVLSLLQPRRREIPSRDLAERKPISRSFWASANPVAHWRREDPYEVLLKLEGLSPPYERWFTAYPDPVDRRILVLLEALLAGVAVISLGDDYEDGASRLCSQTLGVPALEVVFTGLTPQIRCGSPFDLLFQLGRRSNISLGVQDALYRLRTTDLKWNQRDLLDLTVVWALGESHDNWIDEGGADLNEIVSAIRAEEPI